MRGFAANSIAVMAVLLASACQTVGPNFAGPAPLPPQAGYGVTEPPRAAMGQEAPRQWWKQFGSAELDGLVERALAGNQSLAAANATLERARERIRAVTGRTLPQVDARARADYQQVNLDAYGLSGLLGGSGLGNPEFDLYSVGGGISYDLDLFGGNRRAVEQAQAEGLAQQHQTEAAHITIAGRVVNQVLTIAALNDRIASQRAFVREEEATVDAAAARRQGGTGTRVDELAAEGRLAAVRAGVNHNCSNNSPRRAPCWRCYWGLLRQSLAQPSSRCRRLPCPPPYRSPCRPRWCANAPIFWRPRPGCTPPRRQSAWPPRGSIPMYRSARSSTQTTSDPAKLFSGASTGFDLFGGLTAPIFHGGTLKAEKRGAEAAARASAANYRQTVLEAFGQVSGLLAALDNDGRSLTAQRRALDVAQQSLSLTRSSYQAGASGVLQSLEATKAVERARLALTEAQGPPVDELRPAPCRHRWRLDQPGCNRQPY